jgi:hypothetical protein
MPSLGPFPSGRKRLFLDASETVQQMFHWLFLVNSAMNAVDGNREKPSVQHGRVHRSGSCRVAEKVPWRECQFGPVIGSAAGFVLLWN